MRCNVKTKTENLQNTKVIAFDLHQLIYQYIAYPEYQLQALEDYL
jgi:hypothetical protein